MSRILLSTAATVGLFVAAPAMAQTYDASMDCADVWAPGDLVPYRVRLEEQGRIQHNLQVRLSVLVPGRPEIELWRGNTTLGPNEDVVVIRDLKLPGQAPLGEYQMRIQADDGTLKVTDTCSFNVR